MYFPLTRISKWWASVEPAALLELTRFAFYLQFNLNVSIIIPSSNSINKYYSLSSIKCKCHLGFIRSWNWNCLQCAIHYGIFVMIWTTFECTSMAFRCVNHAISQVHKSINGIGLLWKSDWNIFTNNLFD